MAIVKQKVIAQNGQSATFVGSSDKSPIFVGQIITDCPLKLLTDNCIIKMVVRSVKHEITTYYTKKAMADSLKKFMKVKPLSKISVSEIIADCGMNRKTFYYHFEDIYALLKWILEQEAIEVVKGFDLLVAPEEAITFVIDYVNENKYLLNCAYDSMGQEEMKRFFYADLYGVTRSIIESVAHEIQTPIDTAFKDLLTAFYTEALAGMLIDYFKGKQRHDRDSLIHNILFILKHSIPNILIEKAHDK